MIKVRIEISTKDTTTFRIFRFVVRNIIQHVINFVLIDTNALDFSREIQERNTVTALTLFVSPVRDFNHSTSARVGPNDDHQVRCISKR